MIRTNARPLPSDTAFALVLGPGAPARLPVPTGGGGELDGLPCLGRRPRSMPFADWIADSLVRCQGVVAALPRDVWPGASAEFDATVNRIVTLDPTRACGKAWWWLLRLRQSEYLRETAYGQDDLSSVYHTDGVEASANAWLPSNDDYDVLVQREAFDRITLAGFAVSVRYMAPSVGKAPTTLDELPLLQQRMLLELEAASMGTGPAILATMLVHSGEQFSNSELQMASARDELSEAAMVSKTAPIRACVTVSQTHAFRLGDLLQHYNTVLGDPLLRPSLPALNGGIFEMTAAIARKVRALANSRILKLNMTPDTIVFCPRLMENAETGELEAHGYGYSGMHTVKGVPYVWDFDPLYTERSSAQNADYDANCAYVVMMLVLLASVRAQYGEAVARIMINKIIGRGPSGAALPEDELPEDFAAIDIMAAGRASREKAIVFCAVIRSALPAFAKEHEPTLGASYVHVARDFVDIVRSEVLRYWDTDQDHGFERDRSVFQQLVQYLSRSAQADTALFAPATPGGQSAHERERAQTVEQRLDAVREARAQRLFG